MKKYFLFLIGIVLVNISLSLMINADLFTCQKELFSLQQSLISAREKNNRLKREAASLSSLNRIAQLASKTGLAREEKKIVIVSGDRFAMR